MAEELNEVVSPVPLENLIVDEAASIPDPTISQSEDLPTANFSKHILEADGDVVQGEEEEEETGDEPEHAMGVEWRELPLVLVLPTSQADTAASDEDFVCQGPASALTLSDEDKDVEPPMPPQKTLGQREIEGSTTGGLEETPAAAPDVRPKPVAVAAKVEDVPGGIALGGQSADVRPKVAAQPKPRDDVPHPGKRGKRGHHLLTGTGGQNASREADRAMRACRTSPLSLEPLSIPVQEADHPVMNADVWYDQVPRSVINVSLNMEEEDETPFRLPTWDLSSQEDNKAETGALASEEFSDHTDTDDEDDFEPNGAEGMKKRKKK